jgi:hypothetical protein
MVVVPVLVIPAYARTAKVAAVPRFTVGMTADAGMPPYTDRIPTTRRKEAATVAMLFLVGVVPFCVTIKPFSLAHPFVIIVLPVKNGAVLLTGDDFSKHPRYISNHCEKDERGDCREEKENYESLGWRHLFSSRIEEQQEEKKQNHDADLLNDKPEKSSFLQNEKGAGVGFHESEVSEPNLRRDPGQNQPILRHAPHRDSIRLSAST